MGIAMYESMALEKSDEQNRIHFDNGGGQASLHTSTIPLYTIMWFSYTNEVDTSDISPR